jgi:hypothetical protein
MQTRERTGRTDAARTLGYVHKLRLESRELALTVDDARTLPPWAFPWRAVLGKLAGAFTLLSLALWGTQFVR